MPTADEGNHLKSRSLLRKFGQGFIGFISGFFAGFYVGFRKADYLVRESSYFIIRPLFIIQLFSGIFHGLYGIFRSAFVAYQYNAYVPSDLVDVLSAPTSDFFYIPGQSRLAQDYLAEQFDMYDFPESGQRELIVMDLIRSPEKSDRDLAAAYLNSQPMNIFEKEWSAINNHFIDWAILNLNNAGLWFLQNHKINLLEHATTFFTGQTEIFQLMLKIDASLKLINWVIDNKPLSSADKEDIKILFERILKIRFSSKVFNPITMSIEFVTSQGKLKDFLCNLEKSPPNELGKEKTLVHKLKERGILYSDNRLETISEEPDSESLSPGI